MNACFTVDVDCDAAWHCEGEACAVTKGQKEACYEASKKGLEKLLELLEENGRPATFFVEARAAARFSARDFDGHEVACHGLGHEDFTGESTRVKIGMEEKKRVLSKAKKVLEDFCGRKVKGFRAPYLHWDQELLLALKETGFAYDSSMTRNASRVTNENGLKEVPLLELGVNGGNRKSSYLWRLLEGVYGVEEYAAFVNKALKENNFLVLATHSWHLHRSVKKGILSVSAANKNLEKVRGVLDAAEDAGARFATIQNFLEEKQ